ncbi:hypothetical protein M758_UG060800 [Ceratodon purpureus]|nr:hypothetical protein M758_UG060800 [Ceratodon purpureus]
MQAVSWSLFTASTRLLMAGQVTDHDSCQGWSNGTHSHAKDLPALSVPRQRQPTAIRNTIP